MPDSRETEQIVAPTGVTKPARAALALAPRTLVLGGARSGKSVFAESLFANETNRVYFATAEAENAEMETRVLAHRTRRGDAWITIEEPRDLAGVLKAQSRPGRVILVETLTMWLANLIAARSDVPAAIDALAALLPALPAPVVLVSDEVGMGLAPDTAAGREFRDHVGTLNQRLAQVCQRVYFVAAGLPLVLKDQWSGVSR